jgi:hypothetical protein
MLSAGINLSQAFTLHLEKFLLDHKTVDITNEHTSGLE